MLQVTYKAFVIATEYSRTGSEKTGITHELNVETFTGTLGSLKNVFLNAELIKIAATFPLIQRRVSITTKVELAYQKSQ